MLSALRSAERDPATLSDDEYLALATADGDGPIHEEASRRWWEFMERNQLSDLAWSIADKDEGSAALRPGASHGGGWSEDALTPSGRLLRDRLRGSAR